MFNRIFVQYCHKNYKHFAIPLYIWEKTDFLKKFPDFPWPPFKIF